MIAPEPRRTRPPRAAAQGPQWQYRVEFIPLPGVGGILGVLNPTHQGRIDALGADGWELVSVMQGVYGADSDEHGQRGAWGVSLVFKKPR